MEGIHQSSSGNQFTYYSKIALCASHCVQEKFKNIVSLLTLLQAIKQPCAQATVQEKFKTRLHC